MDQQDWNKVEEGAGYTAPDFTDIGPGPDDKGAGDGRTPDERAPGDSKGEASEAMSHGTVERIPPDELEPAAGAADGADAGAEAEELTGSPAREPERAGDEIDPLTRDIEAILFISPEPVSLDVLAEVTGVDGDELSHAVEAVRDKFSEPGGGIVFVELAGGYTFRTNDQALPSVERFCQRPADYSLSAAAMETLAIVAYLQPITRPEIARIRGIGADTVVANLLEKGLLEESGRSHDSGAVKYRTTKVFEKLFGLAGVEALPAVEGFDATPQDVEELRQKLYLAAEKRQ